MEIDAARFEKLLADIAALSATVKGFNVVLEELTTRRNHMAGELARAEEAAATRPLARPSVPQALRDTAKNRERALEPARAELAALDHELRRMNEQAAVAFERLNRLRRLEAACRAWAAERDIVLPGSASGEGRATPQPSPPGRELFSPLAGAPAMQRATSTPVSASPASAARAVFERMLPSISRRA